MTQIPPQSRYERVAGRIQRAHWCKTPGWLARLCRRVRAGDVWACACGQRWRWGVHPVVRSLGIQQLEWIRL